MSTEHDHEMHRGHMTGRGNGPVEEVLAGYVDRINRGETVDPAEVIARHPEVAADILRELETFERIEDSTDSTRPLGTLGDYTLRRQIGRGGMGVVYDAWENSLERRVALKVLPSGVAVDERAFSRFMREARAAGRLNHPNVVGVHAMGQLEGTPYYAMEYVEGETLARVLARMRDAEPDSETPFGLRNQVEYFARFARAFADVADGLQHAHSRGVIHRDIKPSNLILDTSVSAPSPDAITLRILDFGLARLEGQESLTLPGDVMGTPLYMSPEQARRKKIPIDHRTDIYSLGATLYEALTGQPPFRGSDHADTLSRIVERDPVEPRRVNPRVPLDLETIVLKCLHKEPAERFGTAEALGQDLRRFARGEPIEARPTSRLERVVRRARRHRIRIASLSSVVALAVALGWLAIVYHGAARREAIREYEVTVKQAAERIDLMVLTYRLERGSPDRFSPRDDDWADVVCRTLEAAEASLPERPDAPFHRARALLYSRRGHEAVTLLEKLRTRFPRFVPAWALEADTRSHQGDREIARRLWAGAERVASEGWAREWLDARQARRQGRHGEAVRCFETLLERRSLDAEGYVGLSVEARIDSARSRLELEELGGALADLAIATHLSHGALDAAILEGRVLWQLGRKQESERLFESLHATTTLPDEVAVAIGNVFGELGEADRQIDWLDRVGDARIRARRKVRAFDATADTDALVETAEAALELDPGDGEIQQLLGRSLARAGHARVAIERLQEAAAQLPESAGVHARLALLYYSLCFGGEAIRLARRATELAPGWARWPRTIIAWTHIWDGNPEAGFAILEELRREDPFDPWVHHNEGVILVEIGRCDDALPPLARAIELGGSRATRSVYWRGTALLDLGRYAEAEADLRLVKNGYPTEPLAWGKLARAIARQGGRHGEAIDALCDGLERFPASGEFIGLAYGYLEKNAADIPRATYERLIRTLTEIFETRPDDTKNVHRLWATWFYHPHEPGLDRALRVVEQALEHRGWRDRTLLHRLAQTQVALGLPVEALTTCERAVRLPRESLGLPGGVQLTTEEGLLDQIRRELEPDLPSIASIDAALRRAQFEAIVPEAAHWRFFRGATEPPTNWMDPGFDDSGWEEGPGGFGFGDDDDATVLDDMRGRYTSVYVRRVVDLEALDAFERYALCLRVDDGCIAYLNGKEIGRLRVPATPGPMAATAVADSVAAEPITGEILWIDTGDLTPGRNIVAIHGLNRGLGSSDFSLDPTILGVPHDRSSLWMGVRDAFRQIARGDEGQARLAYLEARVLEAKGRDREAAVKFGEVLRTLPGEPIVRLRLAACHERLGASDSAFTVLQNGLGDGRDIDRTVLEAWLKLALEHSTPAETLAAFAPTDSTTVTGVSSDPLANPPPTTPAEDVRWLLERLAAGEAIRINSGGNDFTDARGRLWSHDRFATSGLLLAHPGFDHGPYLGLLHGGGGFDALFRQQRWFRAAAERAYAIPLPGGRYRVRLFFAELKSSEPGWWVYDVFVEGRAVMRSFDPVRDPGYATVVERTVDVDVEDGILEVGIIPRRGTGAIAGLEIERAR